MHEGLKGFFVKYAKEEVGSWDGVKRKLKQRKISFQALKELDAVQSCDLLPTLSRIWETYRDLTVQAEQMLSPLLRGYPDHECKEVATKALELFRNTVLEAGCVSDKLGGILRQCVNNARYGMAVDW